MSTSENVRSTAYRRQGPTKRGQSGITVKKVYLFIYNLLSTLAWSYLLYVTILHLAGVIPPLSPFQSTASAKASLLVKTLINQLPLTLRNASPLTQAKARVWENIPSEVVKPYFERATTLYARIGPEVALIQTTAILEVVHSLLGLVRSPFTTTLAQVASRLWTVWGIVERFPQTHSNPLYALMVIAWCKAEIIRYTFYALSILGYEPYSIKWLRYSAYYVNYPIGASSEAFLAFSTLPPLTTISWTLDEYFRLILFLLWWPALHGLMSYMSSQRRKVLFGKTKTA
ncbi:tyrosine phosphatase-like protein [Cantharellus anzutake]|uniref:tyrosine phosphatase-like protein n=1 Tax=Cantharellus anzutake TaxID=1750568 RepID=UPI0019063A6A|nr:tyrosine phosphatase-like protein [Cantharellus anzutake]KAF8332058.1 tyrosine phosphatase-like protein [Cantharellus anzutake]